MDAQNAVDERRGAIVVLNRDLFFGVRIGNTLRGLGYTVAFAPDASSFAIRLRDASSGPVLGVIDMGAAVDWNVIADLTSDPTVATPILVFGSHLDVDGRRAAKAAGVMRLVSNGEFHQRMVELVERYARAGTGDQVENGVEGSA